jgi:hypothetical protein
LHTHHTILWASALASSAADICCSRSATADSMILPSLKFTVCDTIGHLRLFGICRALGAGAALLAVSRVLDDMMMHAQLQHKTLSDVLQAQDR